jgi:hypothetical protein
MFIANTPMQAGRLKPLRTDKLSSGAQVTRYLDALAKWVAVLEATVLREVVDLPSLGAFVLAPQRIHLAGGGFNQIPSSLARLMLAALTAPTLLDGVVRELRLRHNAAHWRKVLDDREGSYLEAVIAHAYELAGTRERTGPESTPLDPR